MGVLMICALAASAVMPQTLSAQAWEGPVRGSWVRAGEPRPGDVVLAKGGDGCEIVVAQDAHSAVKQAATFLAGDIEKISGYRPSIVPAATGQRVAIHLVTLGDAPQPALPPGIDRDRLTGQWEAHHILTTPGAPGAADDERPAVWLVGANPRGTAFAAYTLSERLGIDPLYLWTGYRPVRRNTLILKQTDHYVPPPTFKYRGLFHDDEDILPRPFEYSGYPLRIGDVPLEWYKRYFETALRLRMNMVAPWTRVHRRFEVQKTASDWGLFYTSHHYDILLSNPFGFRRFKLAQRRGVTGDWDWYENRENMLRYWRGGVEENRELDAIWPVGLRGTDDYGYRFPKGTSEEEQNRVFREVIDAQIELTKDLLPPGKDPVFHFTLYGEMLDKYLAGSFDMPEDVILVWCDDNDGRMRTLPKDPGPWKHGVYYHLAYYGPVAKQSAHLVPPNRIAGQFKQIVDAGVTEFVLVNVSELREFIMEARMIAEIAWDAETALADTPSRPLSDRVLPHVPTAAETPIPEDPPAPSADRYIRWWSAEYFPDADTDKVAAAYQRYYELHDQWSDMWTGSDAVAGALRSLRKKFAGEPFTPANPETLPMLEARERAYAEAFELIEAAKQGMTRPQAQFFFEHVELPLLMDRRPTQAAILLVRAMAEPNRDQAWALCEQAMAPLEQLEIGILRAERPPFEKWYRKTFIRHEETGLNVHRPYEQLRVFLTTGGTEKLQRPEGAARPDLDQFLPLLLNTE